jgi:hypothetical protein
LMVVCSVWLHAAPAPPQRAMEPTLRQFIICALIWYVCSIDTSREAPCSKFGTIIFHLFSYLVFRGSPASEKRHQGVHGFRDAFSPFCWIYLTSTYIHEITPCMLFLVENSKGPAISLIALHIIQVHVIDFGTKSFNMHSAIEEEEACLSLSLIVSPTLNFWSA